MSSRAGSCLHALVGALTVVGLGAGFWIWAVNPTSSLAPPQPSAAQGLHDPESAAHPREAFSPHQALGSSRPARVSVPSIRVRAPLMRLGLDKRGTLASPPESVQNLAGWYAGGVTPGEKGTAVIAGHVDNPDGPGVFYDLGALKKGNTVRVARKDGSTAVFSIYAIEVYNGDNFPDKKVYGPSALPELRLITCGGGFDHERQEYEGNVVVYALMTGTS